MPPLTRPNVNIPAVQNKPTNAAPFSQGVGNVGKAVFGGLGSLLNSIPAQKPLTRPAGLMLPPAPSLSLPSVTGARAASPTLNVAAPKTSLTASQKAPVEQQPMPSTPAQKTQPQPQPLASTQTSTPAPTQGPNFGPGDRSIMPGSDPSSAPPGTPPQQQPQTFTTPSGLVIDGNGNAQNAPAPQQQNFPGLIGQLIGQSQQYQPEIQQTAQQLQQLRSAAAGQEGGYLTAGGTLPVAQGRAQVIAQTEAAQESALNSQLANVMAGQQQSQNALGAAVTATQPQLGQYGQAYYSPLGQSGQTGGQQGGDFSGAMNTYAQGIANNTISPSQIPASISSNPVLQAQLFQQAQQINPSFNATQWQANTAAQQQNLQQTQQQSQQTQQSVSYANSILDDLSQAYNQLSGLQKTPFTPANEFFNWAAGKGWGDSGSTQNYKASTQEARAAVAQALASSGMIGVDQAGSVSQSLIPDNATPSQIAAAKSYLGTFLSQRQTTYTNAPSPAQYGGSQQGATTNSAGSSGGSGLYSF